MDRAFRLRVTVGDDHTIRLPDEVPKGEAEVIVLFPAAEAIDHHRADARTRMFGRLHGKATIADDFDAPLPDDILQGFEGADER